MQVINWDQTGMQLVPAGNARTYHTKNSLDVSVANGDDKRGATLLCLRQLQVAKCCPCKSSMVG
jgi:hypothetical protein